MATNLGICWKLPSISFVRVTDVQNDPSPCTQCSLNLQSSCMEIINGSVMVGSGMSPESLMCSRFGPQCGSVQRWAFGKVIVS